MESLRGHNLCQGLLTASLGIWRVLAISMGLALTSKLLGGWRLFALLASRDPLGGF